MVSSQTKEEKSRFFADLDHLGESEADTASEYEEDVGAKVTARAQMTKVQPPVSVKTRKDVARSALMSRKPPPILRHAATLSGPSINLEDTSRNISKPDAIPKLQRAQSDKTETKVKRKTRSKDDIQLVSEQDRIFDHLVFYFIPNDDIAKPRRLRIRASLAHGATWARTYTVDVTHVIVDVNLDIKAVAKAFTGNIVPENVIMVKDTWLTESIDYKDVPDPTASRFRVKGSSHVSNAKKRVRVSDPVEEVTTSSGQHKRSQQKPQKQTEAKVGDELTDVVREVQKTHDISLGEEVDDTSSLGSTVSESSFEDANTLDDQPPKEQCPEENRGFQCMEKNDGKNTNPNSNTIETLQAMANYYDRTGDSWRTLAYRKGIAALRKQDKWIGTKEQALAVPGIGGRLADKIEEIATTSRLRRLENAIKDPDDSVLQLFMGVYDVGYKQASRFIAQGHRTLEDLIQHADLSANQRIGIAHYDDFQQRIPRAEVSQHGEIVKQALRAVDPQLEAIIGGSYRRNSPDSGDIDILITKKDASIEQLNTLLMSSVIPQLKSSGFLKVALASGSGRSSRDSHDKNTSKWHGASCLPSSTTWRRIDLLFVPWAELGAALLYFTGNDIFNRSMRLLASRKGMRLNQRGLFKDVMRGKGRTKVTGGTLLEGHSEKRIFEILGVPWRPPHQRQC